MLYIYTMSRLGEYEALEYATLDFNDENYEHGGYWSTDSDNQGVTITNYGSSQIVKEIYNNQLYGWQGYGLGRVIKAIIEMYGFNVEILGKEGQIPGISKAYKIIFRDIKFPLKGWMESIKKYKYGEDSEQNEIKFRGLGDQLEYYGDFEGNSSDIYFQIDDIKFKITFNNTLSNENNIAIAEAFIIWLWELRIKGEFLKDVIKNDPSILVPNVRERKRSFSLTTNAPPGSDESETQTTTSYLQSASDWASSFFNRKGGAKKNKKKYKKTSHKKNTRNKNNTHNKKKYKKKKTQKKSMKKNSKKKK